MRGMADAPFASMRASYPVHYDVEQPPRFTRLHLLMRVSALGLSSRVETGAAS
jgi:hypothetical protein